MKINNYKLKYIIAITFLLAFFPKENLGQNIFQKLIDKSNNGDTIYFPSGEHIIDEPIFIRDKRNITIIGNENCRILLTDLQRNVLLVQTSNTINISNLYLSHYKPLKTYECNGGVLYIGKAMNVVIDNCELEGSGTIGISGVNVENIEISNCHIHDNTFHALWFSRAINVLIEKCKIEKNANFLQLDKVDNLSMSDNLIRDNGRYWKEKSNNPGIKK